LRKMGAESVKMIQHWSFEIQSTTILNELNK